MNGPEDERRTTTFVTFYSFKGGVGRSLALLNVAAIIAGLGRRVLIIDFDLEAPGITLLLRDLAAEPTTVVKGVVDLIRNVLNDPGSNVLTGEFDVLREQYIASLIIPAHAGRVAGGLLELLPSGHFDQEYPDQFYDLDLGALYKEGLGQALFERLKEVITGSHRFDYVLIDSRTGLSDESGICTRDLADRLVIVTGLNRQNVEGTCFFLERAQSWRGGVAARLRLVVSPVPLGYELLRQERQQEFMARVRSILRANVEDPLTLSYHPRLALDEDPSFHEWVDSVLFQDYRVLANAILEMAEDTPLDTLRRLQRSLIQNDADRVARLLDELRARDENLLKAVYDTVLTGPPVQAVLTPDMKPARPDARQYLRRLAAMWSDDVLVRVRLGWQERDLGNLRAAVDAFADAVVVARTKGAGVDEASALEELGKARHLRGDYDAALDAFEAALALNETLNRATGIAACTHSIGEIRRTRGFYAVARSDFHGAYAQNLRIGRDQGVASNLHALGLLELFVGDFVGAREQLQEARAIDLRLGRWHGVASNDHFLGWLEHACGNYVQSRDRFDVARDTAERLGRMSALAAALRGMGAVAEATGEFGKAAKYFEEALRVDTKLERPPGVMSSLRCIGGLRLSLGDAAGARDTLGRALDGETELGRVPLIAAVRRQVGRAALEMEDWETALRELAGSGCRQPR